MSTLSYWLEFSKPADGDTSWGGEIRNALDSIDTALHPNLTFFVSPNFTDAALYPNGTPAHRRYFDTIGGALAAINAAALDDRYTILVSPGVYTENLTISKSVNIVGVVPAHSQTAALTMIRGDGSGPPITLTPAAGEVVVASISNCILSQTEMSHGDTTVGWPHWILVNDQGAGNYGAYHNKLILHNVHMRRDALLGTDVFTYGIRVQAFTQLVMHDCQLRIPDTPDFTWPISIEGNFSTSKTAQIHMKQTDVNHSTAGGSYTIRMLNGSSGTVGRCGFIRGQAATVVFGGSGSNSLLGMNSPAEAVACGNTNGYALNISF